MILLRVDLTGNTQPTTTMAAAAAEPTGSTIESLFRPSTRFRDSHRNRRGRLPFQWTEIELLKDLVREDILATGTTTTWADFLATGTSWEGFRSFCQDKVVWMTPYVYVGSDYTYTINTGDPVVLVLRTEAYQYPRLRVHVRMGVAAGAATATCDFLLRLLATCEKDGVFISGKKDNEVPPALSGAGLSRFFQESRPCLRNVTFNGRVFSEDQCLALATMSRLDVELHIFDCSLADDAAEAFVEFLRSDRGPVDLYECRIDSQILANALTGKSRVTRLEPSAIPYLGTNHTEVAVFFRALANNRGLVDLNLRYHPISYDNWMILGQSLQTHPTLTSLNLAYTSPLLLNPIYDGPLAPHDTRIELSAEQRAQRTRVLAQMVQRNTSLHTIELSARQYDQQIYMEMIYPYLVTNRYRPRVLAITKADIPLRRTLLGRALQTRSVRNNSSLLWMFLSRNPDVVVLSNEDDEQVVTEVAATEPVEAAAASAPVEAAASAPSVEEAATRKRKR
jgi:hypothetical protein